MRARVVAFERAKVRLLSLGCKGAGTQVQTTLKTRKSLCTRDPAGLVNCQLYYIGGALSITQTHTMQHLYATLSHLTAPLCTLLLTLAPLLVGAQTPCADESPANDAALWQGYTGAGAFEAANVTDEDAVCDEAMSFRVTQVQGQFFDGGFFYGQDENIDAEPGRTYRVSMRYRSTEDRPIYWRIFDRLNGTTGGSDVGLAEVTLAATTEYQLYETEFTLADDGRESFLFFIGLIADNNEPVFIDDFQVEAVGGEEECTEGPFNDLARWSAYSSSGPAQVVAEVVDSAAVCNNAISADLQEVQSSPFSAGLQINQNESPRFNADAEYRVRFRYRSDVERTIYYRMVPRSLDNSGGGSERFAQDLVATTTYQQFDTVVSSSSGQDSMLYHLWMNGDNLAPIYIDDFSMVQVGGDCTDENEQYNDVANYATYGTAGVSAVMDEDAVCMDAFLIENASIQSGAFSAGFEINQGPALVDETGTTYRIEFSYRADSARTVPVILTSRARGSFGTDDGPQYYYEELGMTTSYQRFSTTFTSTKPVEAADRLIHFQLAVGLDTADIYLDNIVMETVIPERDVVGTFYVHPDGSDENAGDSLSADRAFRTIRYGLSQLIPGDSLLVADGIYEENNLRVLDVRGDADRVTVVKSINPWGAEIAGNVEFNINLQIENSTYIRVEGFEIYGIGRTSATNKATGLQIFGSDYVTVENNFVHDCGCNGISGRESDYMTIVRNVTRDNARYSQFNCSGISVYQPRMLDQEPGTHILIAENVSFENEVRLAFSPLGFGVPTDGNGIILDDFNNTQSFGDQPNDTPPYVAETIVENNLVFGNGGAGIKTFEVERVIIRNNTSYHNNFVLQEFTTNTGEIILQVLGDEAEVYNNVGVSEFGFQSQAFSSQTVTDTAEVILANNLFLGSTVYNGADPQLTENQFVTEDRQSYPAFANAQDSVFFQTFEFTSVNDFRQFFGLREGSPAIDAGANDLAADTDLNGIPRPIGPLVDIGAYEGPVMGVGELPEDRRLLARAVSSPDAIAVDGRKDGLYTGRTQAITKQTVGEADRDDLSGSWTAAYTETELFVLVEVADDSLRSGIDEDGVRLYFDPNNAAGDTIDADDVIISVDYGADTYSGSGSGGDFLGQASSRVRDGGYAIEVAVPWSQLGIVPTDSLRFGFDVQIVDTDADDEDPASTIAWAASRVGADTLPALLGELQLIEVAAPPRIAGTRETITVDGVRDSIYATAVTYVLGNEVQPGIEDEDDFSGNWTALWDSSGIYFLVDITDDVLVNDSDNWFEDDGVEIYIDARNEKATTYDDNDYQLVIEYGGDTTIYDTKGKMLEGATSAITEGDGGYVVEAFIPWTALGVTPSVGYFIGLDVHGIDDDQGGGGNDGKLAWFTTLDESFKNPALFGTAFLGDIGTDATRNFLPAGDWLTVAPNPTAGTLRYTLDAPRQATVQLHDLNGRLLRQRSVHTDRGSWTSAACRAAYTYLPSPTAGSGRAQG